MPEINPDEVTKIRAVLFDLDGTLRDTREVILPAVKHALSVHGIKATEEQIREHSHSIKAVHQNLAPHLEYEKILATYDSKGKELYQNIVLYEGVEELLEKLSKSGVRMGIVSSARSARNYAESIGLDKYFDVIIGGHDVENLKPHPESIEKALKHLELNPEQVVMVGDLAADIVAAKQAGVRHSIGVTHGFADREMLEKAGATYIVDSLLDIENLINSLRSH